MFDNTQDLKNASDEHLPIPAFAIQRLRRWHGPSGMSQEELAGIVGMTTRRLRRLESRKTLPDFLERLIAIAEALGTTLDELIAPHVRRRARHEPTDATKDASGSDTA